jgi:CTP-dependent riboflavin kinase
MHANFTFRAKDWNHHEDVFLQRCCVLGHDGLIMRTSTSHHGDGVLEIMTKQQLREAQGLVNGQEIELECRGRRERVPFPAAEAAPTAPA